MTEEAIRCPNCGALTAPGVEWCGQCYTKLTPDPAEEETPAGAPDVPAPPMPDHPPSGGTSADDPAGNGGLSEAAAAAPGATPKGTPASLLTELWELPTVPEPEVRGTPQGAAPSDSPPPTPAEAPPGASAGAEEAKPRPTWPCAVCGASNDIELDACASCGAPFARLFQEQAKTTEVEPKRAVIFSLIYPGLGHAVAGRKAEGLARAVLFTWAAVTAIILLTSHPAGGLGFLAPMALLFLLAALVWYAVTALDAYRLASGVDQIVTSKVMLYGVAGLMLVSVGSVLLLVTRAGRLH